MANHVHFTIHIEGIEDEQFQNHVKTEKRTIKDWNDNDMEITEYSELEYQPFMANVDKEFDKDGDLKNSYDWYCEKVGAKWCHIEEMQDGYIAGYSAWRQPHELVINIMEFYANMYDTEVSASMTYEDEFRNFMGKQYYGTVEDDGWIAWEGDYCETDADELMVSFNELYPSIDTEAEDFEYHGEYEVDGETIYPSEVLDEIADRFWESC
tara:strand:+ start:122 stop:751 length:630 start_codon:yes stop_codon:yes gene_type:complete